MSEDASEELKEVLERHKVVDPFEPPLKTTASTLTTNAVKLRIYADHLHRIADEAGYCATRGKELNFLLGNIPCICRPNGGN